MLVSYFETYDDLNKIAEFDDSIIEFALGDIAPKFIAFLKSVDLSHPEIPSVFGNYLTLIRQFIETIDRCKDLSVSSKFLSELFAKEIRSKLSEIDSPVSCNRNIRFLSKDQLSQIRLFKKPYSINSCFFYEKAEKMWESIPEDFSLYERHNPKIDSKIQQFGSMISVFREVGLEVMEKFVKDSIVDLEVVDCFGYRSIDVLKACCILAKKNGFSPASIDGRKTLLKNNTEYVPTVVPFGFLNKHSHEVAKTDEEPLINFRAIFDHHIAIVFDKSEELVVLGEKSGSCYFISEEN